ncbi:amidohydrolase family protein [Seohaeicola saemankumensis]|nr:amidohydrolase family protein [Seohaeicola saemankumensis]MCA0873373.1 amidohydrolase family protein [Seohaeicola saemankumensis]
MSWTPGMELRENWLGQVREEIIDPDREIVDPHHHLWNRGGSVYEMEQLWGDTGSGHNVVQTMFMECHAYYDMEADARFRPVGETATVAAMAQDTPTGRAQLAGIISHADLRDPNVGDVLDAHEEAGQGLFRGIRQSGAHDSDADVLTIKPRGPKGLYADPDFRKGMEILGDRGLTYDTWHYHPQAKDFLDLARAVPDTTIILDHFGTPLGVGRFAGKRNEIFAKWKDDMAALAECPNVHAKIGGFAMPDNGWGWHQAERPPTSDEFVEAQADWYHHMIACFGPDRCMFESNFPVDRTAINYPVLWNGLKKIAARYDKAARDAMFAGTARRVYRL